MAKSGVLKLVQSFCREYGQPVPTGLAGSTDAGSLQMRELLQSVGEDIQGRSNWQQCSRLVSWISIVGKDQGSIEAVCAENLDYVFPETFWDMTVRRVMSGPTSDLKWQSLTAMQSQGPLYFYRIAGGRIQTSSSMPAGHTLSLMYKTKNWMLTGNVTPNATLTTDTDTSYFSDTVMKAGLRAFWLRAKQMPHKLEWATYEDAVRREGSQTTVKGIIRTDSEPDQLIPGIIVPTWNAVP